MALVFKKAVKPDGLPPVGKLRKLTLRQRFWILCGKQKGCWAWQGCKDACGYGKLRQAGRGYFAHRLSYEINNGPIPPGKLVLHACDNPSCANPNHLFLGDPAINAADREAKGRGGDHRGTKNGRAKLTVDQVREIRALWDAGGQTKRGLGRRFGVSDCQIGFIVRRIQWKELQ